MAAIHDGDTLTVRGRRIRLWGIDAPELAQRCLDSNGAVYRCGVASRQSLISAIAGRPVRCVQKGTDRYHRIVATCQAGTTDLGAALVLAGRAIDYPAYSHGRYRQEQALAHGAGRGLWSGWFDPPWLYRRTGRHR